jgi:hypothetical protein
MTETTGKHVLAIAIRRLGESAVAAALGVSAARMRALKSGNRPIDDELLLKLIDIVSTPDPVDPPPRNPGSPSQPT